jgi:hypothetical protein
VKPPDIERLREILMAATPQPAAPGRASSELPRLVM